MISKSVIKLFKKFVDISVLDNTESEKDVLEYLENTLFIKVSDYWDENVGSKDNIKYIDNEFTGNYSSCCENAWFIVPNIPIINEVYKKWNETPLFIGKKWIISHLCEDLNVFADLDCYDIELGYFKSDDKTYTYYVDVWGEATLDKENYQDYEPRLCDPKYNNKN